MWRRDTMPMEKTRTICGVISERIVPKTRTRIKQQQFPRIIAPDQLGDSALVATVRKAREALLDACGLAELR
jgi:hypothetical protein